MGTFENRTGSRETRQGRQARGNKREKVKPGKFSWPGLRHPVVPSVFVAWTRARKRTAKTFAFESCTRHLSRRDFLLLFDQKAPRSCRIRFCGRRYPPPADTSLADDVKEKYKYLFYIRLQFSPYLYLVYLVSMAQSCISIPINFWRIYLTIDPMLRYIRNSFEWPLSRES